MFSPDFAAPKENEGNAEVVAGAVAVDGGTAVVKVVVVGATAAVDGAVEKES